MNKIKGNKMKKYILTTAMVFGAMTMSVEAGCSKTSCSDSNGIYRVLPNANGVLLNTWGDETKLACIPHGSGINRYIYLPKTNPNYKALYSTVLAGMVGGKTTSLRAVKNKSTGKCELAYAFLTNKI